MNQDNPKIISDAALHKKVFFFNSSEADNRFFRQKIVDFLNGSDNGKTFTQYMYDAIWECNDGGKTCKYLYFNERSQRLYIDNYFYEWMERTIRKAESELKTMQAK